MEKIGSTFEEIANKLNKIDLNAIAKIYFENKIINNQDYLKNPEKIEIAEFYFNELYEIFKILSIRVNPPILQYILNVFMDLKQHYNFNMKNHPRKILECVFDIIKETKINIPLIKKEKNTIKIEVYNLDEIEEKELYFYDINKKIKKFLSNKNKLFDKCNFKTQELYFYLVNDFNILMKNQSKDEDKNKQFINFDIKDYFKSDSHFELKVFYNDRINKKYFSNQEGKKITKPLNIEENKDYMFLHENKDDRTEKDLYFLNKKRYIDSRFEPNILSDTKKNLNINIYQSSENTSNILKGLDYKRQLDKGQFRHSVQKITSIYNGKK